MSTNFTVIYDANIFFGAFRRSLMLHLAESYVVTPFALGQRFSLNRVMIFVAFIFCAWLWGVAGALLAVPLLMSLKIVCERVPGLSSVAVFLSD